MERKLRRGFMKALVLAMIAGVTVQNVYSMERTSSFSDRSESMSEADLIKFLKKETAQDWTAKTLSSKVARVNAALENFTGTKTAQLEEAVRGFANKLQQEVAGFTSDKARIKKFKSVAAEDTLDVCRAFAGNVGFRASEYMPRLEAALSDEEGGRESLREYSARPPLERSSFRASAVTAAEEGVTPRAEDDEAVKPSLFRRAVNSMTDLVRGGSSASASGSLRRAPSIRVERSEQLETLLAKQYKTVNSATKLMKTDLEGKNGFIADLEALKDAGLDVKLSTAAIQAYKNRFADKWSGIHSSTRAKLENILNAVLVGAKADDVAFDDAEFAPSAPRGSAPKNRAGEVSEEPKALSKKASTVSGAKSAPKTGNGVVNGRDFTKEETYTDMYKDAMDDDPTAAIEEAIDLASQETKAKIKTVLGQLKTKNEALWGSIHDGLVGKL